MGLYALVVLGRHKPAGRSGRLAEKLLRYDLIVIDELGYVLLPALVICIGIVIYALVRRKPA